jgi:hypothetical protein
MLTLGIYYAVQRWRKVVPLTGSGVTEWHEHPDLQVGILVGAETPGEPGQWSVRWTKPSLDAAYGIRLTVSWTKGGVAGTVVLRTDSLTASLTNKWATLQDELAEDTAAATALQITTTYDTLTVTVKTRGVFAVVNAAANKHSRIHRCEASGEILSGGNFYVSVELDRSLVAEMTVTVREELAKANDWQGFSITDSPNNGCGYRFSAWGPKGHVGAGHTRDQVIDAIATAALKAGL